MSENKNMNNEQEVRREKRLLAHEENRKLRSSLMRWRIAMPIAICLSLVIGALISMTGLLPINQSVKTTLSGVGNQDSQDKFQSVLSLMENNWFFGKDIEDLETRLTDQALYGMTANEEDPHTSYMSASEVESFTQSINRNFVGIGVTYRTETDGSFVIISVIHHSPAESVGLMAGDIIYAVDGVSVEGLSSDQLKERITGEEGTNVKVSVKRGGEVLTFTITRAEITSTVYGEILEENIGHLEIAQFGETTAQEIRDYLNEFVEADVEKLIIDLRGNGGGYLDSVRAVSSLFLPGNTVVLQQVYSDDSVIVTKTVDGVQYDFSPIVILIDGDTASASEVFTLAMTENRDDVTTVGTLTYGKGTVQITSLFDDNSGLKYTTSKWISSQGVWVNHVGITPDITIELPGAIQESYTSMEEDSIYSVDQVSTYVEKAQIALSFMGYEVDRTDGYLSEMTADAIEAFRQENGLSEGRSLDTETYETIVSRLIYIWNTDDSLDPQLQKAISILQDSDGSTSDIPEGELSIVMSNEYLYEDTLGVTYA